MRSAVEKRREVAAEPARWPGRSDEDLLDDYRRTGKRETFNELVHRYERELYNYLRRYLGDATLAEDAFQATFLQVHLKCGLFDFEAERKFRPWVYAIATHQAIDMQRRTKRHKVASLDRRDRRSAEADLSALVDLLSTREAGPAARLEESERREWIRREVDRLPSVLRGAVTMVYFQGMSYREAADLLGVPLGTVKSRLHAAVLKLNEAWTHEHPAEEI